MEESAAYEASNGTVVQTVSQPIVGTCVVRGSRRDGQLLDKSASSVFLWFGNEAFCWCCPLVLVVRKVVVGVSFVCGTSLVHGFELFGGGSDLVGHVVELVVEPGVGVIDFELLGVVLQRLAQPSVPLSGHHKAQSVGTKDGEASQLGLLASVHMSSFVRGGAVVIVRAFLEGGAVDVGAGRNLPGNTDGAGVASSVKDCVGEAAWSARFQCGGVLAGSPRAAVKSVADSVGENSGGMPGGECWLLLAAHPDLTFGGLVWLS